MRRRKSDDSDNFSVVFSLRLVASGETLPNPESLRFPDFADGRRLCRPQGTGGKKLDGLAALRKLAGIEVGPLGWRASERMSE